MRGSLESAYERRCLTSLYWNPHSYQNVEDGGQTRGGSSRPGDSYDIIAGVCVKVFAGLQEVDITGTAAFGVSSPFDRFVSGKVRPAPRDPARFRVKQPLGLPTGGRYDDEARMMEGYQSQSGPPEKRARERRIPLDPGER